MPVTKMDRTDEHKNLYCKNTNPTKFEHTFKDVNSKVIILLSVVDFRYSRHVTN